MNLPDIEYDLVVSLGGNCAAAGQLRMRGKRYVSLPFDWTLMRDVRPVKYLPEGFRTRFKDFCRYENATEYEPAVNEFGKETLRVQDGVSGYCFTHHFHHSLDDRAAFEKDRAVLERRIDRLYDLVLKYRSVLFVLETSFEYDEQLLTAIHAALSEVFPSTNIYLAAMQFAAKERVSMTLGSGIFLDRYERPMNIVYDNQFTAPEWLWMDSLTIRGQKTAEQLRKSNLLIKWKYKLWMYLGKSLRDVGAGCANMRFRRFDRYDI